MSVPSWELGPPPPPQQASVSPPLDPKRGSNTRLRVRGWGDPIRTTREKAWHSVCSCVLPPPSHPPPPISLSLTLSSFSFISIPRDTLTRTCGRPLWVGVSNAGSLVLNWAVIAWLLSAPSQGGENVLVWFGLMEDFLPGKLYSDSSLGNFFCQLRRLRKIVKSYVVFAHWFPETEDLELGG